MVVARAGSGGLIPSGPAQDRAVAAWCGGSQRSSSVAAQQQQRRWAAAAAAARAL